MWEWECEGAAALCAVPRIDAVPRAMSFAAPLLRFGLSFGRLLFSASLDISHASPTCLSHAQLPPQEELWRSMAETVCTLCHTRCGVVCMCVCVCVE